MIEKAIEILNEAFAADPRAIRELIGTRVKCNQDLADHPAVVCGTVESSIPEEFDIGPLGLMNGVLKMITGEVVAASYSDDDSHILLGFVKFTPRS